MTFKIPLTIADLPPAATVAIGSAMLRIDAITEALRPYDHEPAPAACLKVAAILTSAVAFARGLEADARTRFHSMAGEITRAQASVEREVPTSGFADVNARLSEVGKRRDDVLASRAQVAFEEAASAKADHATKLENLARAALADAGLAVAVATAEADGPRTFAGRMDADELAVITSLRAELASERPSRLARMYDGLVTIGDEDRLRAFVLATTALLDAVARGSLQELADTIGVRLPMTDPSGGTVGQEKQAAIALRDKFRQERVEKIPESLKVATTALAQLQATYATLFGNSAAVLNREEYARIYLSGGARDPLATNPNWAVRLAWATVAVEP